MKPKVPPSIADSSAMKKAEFAAEAVGMTVAQLADLLVDNGLAAVPSSDGVTESYTMKDAGERLWADMQSRPVDQRAEWFGSLAPTQQIATIVVLRDYGFRTEVVARELGTSQAKVMRTWSEYASQLGAQVVGIRLDTIAGQLNMAKERAQQLAIDSEDHAGFWRIEKEFTAMLQSLGIVDKAIHRVEVTHKVSDEQRAEIDAFVTLEQKKLNRQEEIKQIDATVTDEVPDDITEDYEEQE